mgnify:CR=1 FL=1
MKRKYEKGDAVTIGKFQPLSTMGIYEGKKGRIEKLTSKVLGQWTYVVKLMDGEMIRTGEKYLKPRKQTLICEQCGESFGGYHETICPECFDYSVKYEE